MAVIERNFDEVIDLVHARKATVAWHRSRGPEFIQRNMEPVQNPTKPLVKTVDGVTSQQLIASMAQAFRETGSQRLVGDITQFLPSTLKYGSCNTLADTALLIILESVAKVTPAGTQKCLRTLDPSLYHKRYGSLTARSAQLR